MARVITFSRTFPAYHPKKGQPTYFVEKFLRSFFTKEEFEYSEVNPYVDYYFELTEDLQLDGVYFDPKHHTIRAGHRWKAGDYFSPRVWSGKPYNSPMITIAPDTLITKTWDFEVYKIKNRIGCILINGEYPKCFLTDLAKNDGLTFDDLEAWFKYPKPFSGQIICWNESVNY